MANRELMTEVQISEASDDPKADGSFGSCLAPILQQLRDVQESARTLIPIALDRQVAALKEHKEEWERIVAEMKPLVESSTPLPPALLNDLLSAHREGERLKHQNMHETLLQSLFIGSFALFDGFMGELLLFAFGARPDLMKALSAASLSVGDILSAGSLDDCKAAIVSKEIDSIRRESYPEQFERIEKLFGLALRKFGGWPTFVEAGQRRNLVTHCGGLVTTQYLTMCKREGVQLDPKVAVGQRLHVDVEYFLEAIPVLMEVALKLVHTLWRKLLPVEREKADKHLNTLIYEALHYEEWKWARTVGEFAVGQVSHSSDVLKRMMIVNLGQAYYHLGQHESVSSLLSQYDWSAVSPDFRLATYILRKDIGSAVAEMKMIGPKGAQLTELSYYTWPIFRDLRTRPEFEMAFEEIYGHPFSDDLGKHLKLEAAVNDGQTE